MNYVTPTNYLELVQGYMKMLKAVDSQGRVSEFQTRWTNHFQTIQIHQEHVFMNDSSMIVP